MTHEEVEAALKRLKRNKGAGVDGIRAEFILDAATILLTLLVLTFDQIVNKGVHLPGALVSSIQSSRLETRMIPGNYICITVVIHFLSCMQWC